MALNILAPSGTAPTKYIDAGSPLAIKGSATPVLFYRGADYTPGAQDQLTDLTGNGYHGIPLGAGGKPTVNANILNGNSVISFDGVGNLTETVVALSRPFELQLLFKRNAFTTANFLAELRNVTLGAYIQQFNATTVRSIIGGATTFNTTLAVGAWALLRIVAAVGATASRIELNNSTAATTPASGEMTADIQKLTLGGKVGGVAGQFSNPDIAEVLLLSGTVDATYMAMLTKYRNRRYGLTLP